MRYGFVISAILVLTTICSSVYAQSIFGGDPITYNFQRCEWLTVNITNAVLNEWNATPNCVEQSAGNFYCTCVNNYNLTLTPKPNSVGTFSITLNNYWTEQSSTGGGGSYGGGCTPAVVYKNTTTIIEKPIYIDRTVNNTIYVPVNNTVEKTVYQVPDYMWVVVVIGLACAFGAGIFVANRRKKPSADKPIS